MTKKVGVAAVTDVECTIQQSPDVLAPLFGVGSTSGFNSRFSSIKSAAVDVCAFVVDRNTESMGVGAVKGVMQDGWLNSFE